MFKKTLSTIALWATVAHAFAISADFAQCEQMFANGTPPAIQVQSDVRPRTLCLSEFAILHSGKSHTPVYIAERLNKELLTAAKDNARSNRFFADARLPRSERAQLDDYKNSGFDRGHMAPAGDMATAKSMAQSFSARKYGPASASQQSEGLGEH